MIVRHHICKKREPMLPFSLAPNSMPFREEHAPATIALFDDMRRSLPANELKKEERAFLDGPFELERCGKLERHFRARKLHQRFAYRFCAYTKVCAKEERNHMTTSLSPLYGTLLLILVSGCKIGHDPNAMPATPPPGVVRANLELGGSCAALPRTGQAHIRRNQDELVVFYEDDHYQSTSVGVKLSPFQEGKEHALVGTQHAVRVQRNETSSMTTFRSKGGSVVANAFNPETGAINVRFNQVVLSGGPGQPDCTLNGTLAFRGRNR